MHLPPRRPVPCRDPSVCLCSNPAARPRTCRRAGALRAVGRSWGQRWGPLGTAGAGDRGASPNKALSIRLPPSPLAQFGICAAREHKRGQTIGTGEPPGPVGPGSFVPASFPGRRSPRSSVSFVPSWRRAGERRAGQVHAGGLVTRRWTRCTRLLGRWGCGFGQEEPWSARF